jgi:hypothetical protein
VIDSFGVPKHSELEPHCCVAERDRTAKGAADYIVRDVDEIRTLRLRLVPDRIGTAIDVQSWERNLVLASEDG